jgi:hypothetical protein
MPLKVLIFSFVLLCWGKGIECAQISPFARLGILLAGIYRECFKNRNMARRRPEFGTDKVVAEAAQLQEAGRCRQFQIQ